MEFKLQLRQIIDLSIVGAAESASVQHVIGRCLFEMGQTTDHFSLLNFSLCAVCFYLKHLSGKTSQVCCICTSGGKKKINTRAVILWTIFES